MAPRVLTINGLAKAYKREICEFQGRISSEILRMDINFGHPFWLDTQEFGLYWLASLCNTGHLHIVLVPVPGLKPDAWPVAFYDQESGLVETFASTIRNWFPCYLIFVSEKPHFAKYFPTFAKELCKHCQEHFDFDAKELVKGRAAGTMTTSQAYALTEEGSFLHRFWRLREAKDVEGMRALSQQFPFFNAPLYWLWQEDLADPADCKEILHRHLRIDFGQDGKRVLSRLKLKDKALLEIARAKDPAPKFLEAGRLYQQRGEALPLAFSCFQNAIYLTEDEDIANQSFQAIQSIVQESKDRAYLSYLKKFPSEIS